MKSLHSYYCQLRSSQQAPSGSSTEDVASKKITWQWYEPLNFLSENYISDPTLSGIGGYDLADLKNSIDTTNKRKRKSDGRATNPNSLLLERAVVAMEKDSTPARVVDNPPRMPETKDRIFSRLIQKKMSEIPECDEKEDLILESN